MAVTAYLNNNGIIYATGTDSADVVELSIEKGSS